MVEPPISKSHFIFRHVSADVEALEGAIPALWDSAAAAERAEEALEAAASKHAKELGQKIADEGISIHLHGSLPLGDDHSHKDLASFLENFALRQTTICKTTESTIEASKASLMATAAEVKESSLSQVKRVVSSAVSSLNDHLIESEALEETVQRLQHEREVEKTRADAACEQLAALKLQLHDTQNQLSRLSSERQAQERETLALMQALQSGEQLLQIAAANVAKQHSVICELQDENLQLIDSSFSSGEPAAADELPPAARSGGESDECVDASTSGKNKKSRTA